jgi:GNAT superfamily N-acetyltransferase
LAGVIVEVVGGRVMVLRGAGPDDVRAARALHRRCSPRTLASRYRGPVGEADRYLGHLLDPRHGRAVAVEGDSGELVGLGHLMWDGDEAEVALLVADAWQRRGVGSVLLRRLLEMAAEARREVVYAVTEASNAGMIAAMRGTGLPLDHHLDEGTLVLAVRLMSLPVGAAALPVGTVS